MQNSHIFIIFLLHYYILLHYSIISTVMILEIQASFITITKQLFSDYNNYFLV